jgi:hypothetical protein
MINRSCRHALFFTCVLLVSRVAFGDSHSYRFQLESRIDQRFAGEIAAGTGSAGPRYDVETDKQGRIVDVVINRDGVKIQEVKYHYENGAQFARTGELYIGGELTKRVLFERDAAGQMTRTEYRTAQGELTAYRVQSFAGDHADWVQYTAAGVTELRGTTYFSVEGIVIRVSRALDSNNTVETTSDPSTGLDQSLRQMEGGQLTVEARYTYDLNGGLIRMDKYHPDGHWFGSQEFAGGLMTRELTQGHDDNPTKETRFTYDEKRFAANAEYLIDGKLVCQFVYDRFPNGTMKRTLALGPGGVLFAEYPDNEISWVHRNGKPGFEVKGMTIYRQGDWW